MSERVYGAKYNENLKRADITRAIRKDIALAVAAGTLPEATYTVRLTKGRGKMIHIEVSDLGSFAIFTMKVFQKEAGPRAYTGATRGLLNLLRKMAEAYNFDGSDVMSDYFDVHFYLDVRIAGSAEDADKARASGVPACAKCGGWLHHFFACANKLDMAERPEAAEYIRKASAEQGWPTVGADGVERREHGPLPLALVPAAILGRIQTAPVASPHAAHWHQPALVPAADRARRFELDGEPVDLLEFLANNKEGLDMLDVAVIHGLEVGSSITFGGGASAEFILTRVA